MSKSRIPDGLRSEIVAQFGCRCAYCQTQQQISGIRLTVDHTAKVTSYDPHYKAAHEFIRRSVNRIGKHEEYEEIVFAPSNSRQ